MVDATIVAAPKQRNNDGEKATIKEGRVPDEWKENPAKLRQKDRDARWTVKYSRAKYVFVHQKGPMAAFVRTIGKARAETKIGMVNLAYNMRRFLWLESQTMAG